MVTHLLRACRPEPLGSYLTALGILRLVGQQIDAAATGWWAGTGFTLTTELEEEDLLRFFLTEYRPTPMVSPWNKGAGYRGDGKSKKAETIVALALGSTSDRFRPWRDAIEVAQQISASYPEDKHFTESKDEVIARSRALLPDEALEWLDAAVALTENGPAYPHILGTGGNLGRLDLSANVLARLDSVIGLREPADETKSRRWLIDALFGSPGVPLEKSSAGQFDPGRAGGVNASTLDGAKALINPWSFVLQLEGAVMFASGVARRLGSAGDNAAAMPFTVRPTAAGAGHLSDDEAIKGELWSPLWSTPSTFGEVRRLFAEARLRWGSGNATTATDAARAVATLGTDRGIPVFSRSVIVERLGQSPLAVPAGRVATGRYPSVGITAALDPWLRSARRLGGPASLSRALRMVDRRLLELATATSTAPAFQAVLQSVATVEDVIRTNDKLRSDHRPLPPLVSEDWLQQLDDSTPEFAVAWAIASLSEVADDPRRVSADRRSWAPSVRDYIRGTVRSRRFGPLGWSDGPRLRLDVVRDPIVSLARIHMAHAAQPRQLDGVVGDITTMRYGMPVASWVIEALVAGQLDERRIGELVRILVLLDIDAYIDFQPSVTGPRRPVRPSPAWRVLAPLFPAGRAGYLEIRSADGTEHTVATVADASWPAMLARGAVEPVLRAALTRRRTRFGDDAPWSVPDLVRATDGQRLAAALAIPFLPGAARHLIVPNRDTPTSPTFDTGLIERNSHVS